MSDKFDWRTEEDERAQSSWDEPIDDKPAGPPRRRPPWRLIAVISVLAVMAGAIVWWRVDKRIDETMQAVRTDVVASHNLVQRAVADGDEEIFRSFLSGRDPAWTEGELEVFRRQLFADRSPLGLIPAEGSLPAILSSAGEEIAAGERPAAIELSPDFNEAIVTINQPYQTEDGDTVVLEQTAVYRRGDNRWLLAPPLDEFWGEWVTSEGAYLNLIYPARDETVGARLAADLDAEIGRMCDTLEDIDCSADLHLTARLDTDPATLASLSRLLGPLRRAREREDILELPAPTLVGLPVEADEAASDAGYAALRDGYARHLLSAVIAQAVGWDCCDEEVLFDLLLEYQLGELGLLAWPTGEDDYRRVLDDQLRLSDLNFIMRGREPAEFSDEQLWIMRTTVDFLAKGLPGVSVAGMQRMLQGTRTSNQFLNGVLLSSNSTEKGALPPNLDSALWLYATGRTISQTDEPIPPADEELYLACQAVDGNQGTDLSRLLRYGRDNNQWAELYNRQGFIWMSALPDPGMMLVQEFDFNSESWQTNIWRDGGLTPAYVGEDTNFSISFGETDPAGRQLITYAFDDAQESVQAFKIDLADCDDGCATAELPGLPAWSPDGAWAIYAGSGDSQFFAENTIIASNQRYILLDSSGEFGEFPLTLGPGDAGPESAELMPVATGHSPFWIDDRTFGYIRRLDMSEFQPRGHEDIIFTSTLDDPTPHKLLSASDLAQFLPDENRLRRMTIAYVATHPDMPRLLFITVLDELDRRAFVFSYDLDEGMAQLRMDLLYNLGHSLGFSPDGRYLVLTGQDRDDFTSGDDSAVLLLHDIAANRTIPFMIRLPYFLPSVVYDWTEDGRRLAMVLDDNLVGLFAPQEGHTEMLAHGYGACTSVAWLAP